MSFGCSYKCPGLPAWQLITDTSHPHGLHFRPEAIPEADCLDLPSVIARISRAGKRARVIPDADAIVSQIAGELRSGDVVAILSNGGFGGIYEKLPQRLRSHPIVATAQSRP